MDPSSPPSAVHTTNTTTSSDDPGASPHYYRASVQNMALEIEKIESMQRRKHNQSGAGRSCKQKTHLCCVDPFSSEYAFWWNVFLSFAVMLSIFALFWESWALFPTHDPGHPTKLFFDIIETILCCIFTGELFIRLYVSPLRWSSVNVFSLKSKYSVPSAPSNLNSLSSLHSLKKWKQAKRAAKNIPFFKDFLNYLDLIAILPTFIKLNELYQPQPDIPPESFSTIDVFVNFLKVTRAVRLYKVFRSHSGTKILWKTVQGSSRPILVILPVLGAFLLVGGPLILLVEPCIGEDCVFKDSFSAGYFLTITLTTVGYGDQIPTQNFSMILAMVTMLFGSVFFAMPLAIIGNQFQEAYDKWEKEEELLDSTKALRRFRKEFHWKLIERRTRITKALFSILYDIQRCEVIIKNTEEERAKASSSGLGPSGAATRATTDTDTEPHHFKLVQGPAAKALIDLSRKHMFLRVDLGNLYKSHQDDHELPSHVKSIMQKITSPAQWSGFHDIGGDHGREKHLQQRLGERQKEQSRVSGVSVGGGFNTASVRATVKSNNDRGRNNDGNTNDGNTNDGNTNDGNTNDGNTNDGNDGRTTQGDAPSEAPPSLSSAYVVQQRSSTEKRRRKSNTFNLRRVQSRKEKIKKAVRRGGCRNKLWLALENHHSSPWAEKIYITRMIIYLCAVVQMMVSTWPEYNAYGNAQRQCRRLVVNYCNLIATTDSIRKPQWVAANPGCFPNASTGYSGCLNEHNCQFPSPQHNMTCPQNALFQGCDVHPHACSNSTDRENSIVSIIGYKYWNVPLCQRRACVDNFEHGNFWKNGYMTFDGSVLFAYLETMFLVFFWFEYVLRLYLAGIIDKRKKFCRREYMSLMFVVTLTLEYAMMMVRNNGTFVYDPWGLPLLEHVDYPFRVDSHSLRLFRLVVPARFVWITCDFKGIANLKLTMQQTAHRLVPFVFMFSICCIQLTFFMFYAEIVSCKPMLVNDKEGNQIWRYTRANLVDDCNIQDMADAFWLIMVTLTSVGYGGRYPQTSGGKAIAMFAAMFGLFAQAMPLTIIGNTFYNIHINQERNRRKLHGKFKLRKAVFKISNRMVVYHHDSHHDENILLCNSGYEKLHKSLRMRREHYKIIDQYIAISRNDLHAIKTSAQMAEFSNLHDQVVKVISLYLHSSDAAEVMNKQEQIARQLVESEFGHKSEEHKSKLITSTFRHLSTRYIDGISFTSSTRGIDDTEDDIEQKF